MELNKRMFTLDKKRVANVAGVRVREARLSELDAIPLVLDDRIELVAVGIDQVEGRVLLVVVEHLLASHGQLVLVRRMLDRAGEVEREVIVLREVVLGNGRLQIGGLDAMM